MFTCQVCIQVDQGPPLLRNNLLGTLLRDSTSIGLYDIQPTMVGNDEVEPSFLERAVLPGVTGVVGATQSSDKGAITSFSWHPTQENRLLNISLSGSDCKRHLKRKEGFTWVFP